MVTISAQGSSAEAFGSGRSHARNSAGLIDINRQRRIVNELMILSYYLEVFSRGEPDELVFANEKVIT